ncbi:hypothetical protein AMTR_s00105p00144140 [Amborella trichopoda]|uniref:Uncharacterized protein n=1 Tax=Amborella trichopoda TaxID=13333 RepID=W1NSI8_AMBTC|nr:hypothetical protein AMTR_s00105p00144140 [Amborella trichopoda]
MASNPNGTSIPIVPLPHGEMPFVSKVGELLSETEVFYVRVTKIEDNIQWVAHDFEVVEDGLKELRSSVYRY